MCAAKKKVVEDDEEDDVRRKPAREDGEEESGESSSRFNPSQYLQKAKDWADENPRLATILLGVLVFLFVLFLALLVLYIISVRNRPTIEHSLTAYELGAYTQARRFAGSVLRYSKEKETEKRATALFVLGASTLEQYENIDWSDKSSYYLTAANHLKEAYDLGFPLEIRAKGLYYYGKALYLTDNMPQCVKILLQAEELGEFRMKEVYWFLANACGRTEEPDYNLALDFCDRFLGHSTTTQFEMYEGGLLQASLLLRLGRIDEASRAFDRVPIVDELEAFQEFVCAQILMEEARDYRRKAMQLEKELMLGDSPFDSPKKEGTDSATGPPSESTLDFTEPENADPFPLESGTDSGNGTGLGIPGTGGRDSGASFFPKDSALGITRDYALRSLKRPVAPTPDFWNLTNSGDPIVSETKTEKERPRSGITTTPVVPLLHYDEVPASSSNTYIREVSHLLRAGNQGRIPEDFHAGLTADSTAEKERKTTISDAKKNSPPGNRYFAKRDQRERYRRQQSEAARSRIQQVAYSSETPGSDQLAYERLQEYRTQSLQRYNEAILRLEMCKFADAADYKYTREAFLLQGFCFEEMGELSRAQDMYREIVKMFPESPEAIAAEFMNAEILRRKGQFESALAGYYRCVQRLVNIGVYVNPLLTGKEIQLRVEIAFGNLVLLGAFEEAFRMIDVFRDILPKGLDAKMRALGYERWAKDLRRKANASHYAEREKLGAEMRKKFRSAGKWFAELARYEFTGPNFKDLIWTSAENYRAGKDYLRAVPMYREYLKHELQKRQAETLAILGQLYFDLDLLDPSIEMFEEFLADHGKHPLVYHVRLIKAYAHQEKGETDKTEELLLENLSGVLAPQAPEYRDSIYALGRMHYSRKDFERALDILEHAVILHPEAVQVADAYYMIAQSYLSRVESSDEKVRTTNLSTTRERASLESQNARNSALEFFEKTRAALNVREQEIPLSESEQMMQLICYFEIAKQQLALERYDEALLSFESAQTRFQERPETLDALIQVAQIYRLKGKSDQAKETINRGKVLLQRLSAMNAFPPGYRFNEQEWKELLDWQSRN